MSTLVVDRMTASSPPGLQARTRGLLAGVADRRLGDALHQSPLPEGDWYLRRLDVTLALDPARPDPSIEETWAGAVVDALHAALRTRSANVVHYRHRLDALVDLVASLAAGSVDRAWAWQRAGILDGADPPRPDGSSSAALTALRAAPESVVAVLVGAVHRVGLPRLHRLLGASGWAAVAELAAGAVRASVADELRRHADLVRARGRKEGSSAPSATPVPPGAAALAERVSAALASSRLAAAFRGGSLRPDELTATAWAVLALAEVDPAVLRRADVAAVIESAVGLLPGPTRDPSPPAAGAGFPAAGTAEDTGDVPPSWPTVWGGLLFLLAAASEAGVPEVLTDDPLLGERPLSWSLHALATRLVPAAADDPALLVFAGLPVPFEEPSVGGRPPRAAENARLDVVARAWAVTTAGRLGRENDEDPFEVVREVALRRGEIVWEPGWVDLHLRLVDVDVDVRRAGLDLDPGWVPWLGTVVRFVHG